MVLRVYEQTEGGLLSSGLLSKVGTLFERTQDPHYTKKSQSQKTQYPKTKVLKNHSTQNPHYSKTAVLKYDGYIF